MNAYENAIKECLEQTLVYPGEELRNRVMQNVSDEANHTPRVYRRRLSLNAAFIAAIITILALTTAAAYGAEIVDAIRQIFFGESIGTQILPEHELHSGSWGVMNRSDLAGATDYPLGSFQTLEEARLAAPFYIGEPAFLPANVKGIRGVGVWRVEDPDNPWMHFVILNYEIENDGRTLELMQVYAGPDAYIDVRTVDPIEKIMIGNNEAMLIVEEGKFITEDGVISVPSNSKYTLWWLNDEIAYQLSCYQDIIDLDVMIAIAESIR